MRLSNTQNSVDEIQEFYDSHNLTKLFKHIQPIPDEEPVTCILTDFIQHFPSHISETRTPKKSAPQKSHQKIDLDKSKTLFLLILKLDFLVFAQKTKNSVRIKPEFNSLVAKLRSELKKHFKLANEFISNFSPDDLIAHRQSLLCLLDATLTAFSSDPISLNKLHIIQELMTFVLLILNLFANTGLQDSRLSESLADVLFLLLQRFLEHLSASNILEILFTNLLQSLSLPIDKRLVSTIQSAAIRNNLKTDETHSILLKKGILVNSDLHGRNLLLFIPKSMFGISTLFKVAGLFAGQSTPFVLFLPSAFHLFFTKHMEFVFGIPVEANPLNVLFLKKFTKILHVLISGSDYLREIYSEPILLSLIRAFLKSQAHFEILQPLILKFIIHSLSFSDSNEVVLQLPKKVLLLPTLVALLTSFEEKSCEMTDLRYNNKLAKIKLTFEDGDSLSLENLIDHKSEFQKSGLLSLILDTFHATLLKFTDPRFFDFNFFHEISEGVIFCYQQRPLLTTLSSTFPKIDLLCSLLLKILIQQKLDASSSLLLLLNKVTYLYPNNFSLSDLIAYKEFKNSFLENESSKNPLVLDSSEFNENSTDEKQRRHSEFTFRAGISDANDEVLSFRYFPKAMESFDHSIDQLNPRIHRSRTLLLSSHVSENSSGIHEQWGPELTPNSQRDSLTRTTTFFKSEKKVKYSKSPIVAQIETIVVESKVEVQQEKKEGKESTEFEDVPEIDLD